MTAPALEAVRVVAVSLDVKPETLVVFDAHRRTYLGLSRKGDYWHVVRPAHREDPVVMDGKVVAGALTCSCPAGAFARRCYWTQLAEALEQGDRGFVLATPEPDPDDIAWMRDAAPGEIVDRPRALAAAARLRRLRGGPRARPHRAAPSRRLQHERQPAEPRSLLQLAEGPSAAERGRRMKLAITADWHVDQYGGRVDPETGLNARLTDYLRTAAWVAAEARRRDCEALIVCGDLTERRHASPWLVARIREALAEGPDRVVLLQGNHDGARAGRSIVNVLGAVPSWSGVSVPEVVRVGPLAICAIPYLDRHWLRTQPGFEAAPDADLFRVLGEQYLTIARGLYAQAMAEGATSAILAGHQTLAGGRMSDTQQAFLGDLSLVIDSRALSAIGYELVAFGHLHRSQVVVDDPACPVVYAGSIERVDFGEATETKSFLVVDVEPGKATMEFVETPARPFVTLTGAEIEAGVTAGQIDGAIVRVRDLDPLWDAAALRRELEAAGAFEVQEIRTRPGEKPEVVGGMAEGLTAPEALEQYFDGDPDREVLVERGRQVLVEVGA